MNINDFDSGLEAINTALRMVEDSRGKFDLLTTEDASATYEQRVKLIKLLDSAISAYYSIVLTREISSWNQDEIWPWDGAE